MRFNIEDYPGNYAMHCKTLIEAKSFLAHLNGIGKTWNGGMSYIHHENWFNNEENTCYEFNAGRYSYLSYFKESNWTILEWSDFMYDTPAGKIDENNDYDKTLITIDNMDFFRLPEENGLIPIVARDCVVNARFNDNTAHTNNFAESPLLQTLITVTLPKVEAALGADNVVYFETDLTTICGNKKYGTINTKISLPTFDLYRNNIEIFNKYSTNMCHWWLATPWRANCGVCLVLSNEDIYYENERYSYGVRPLLYIKAEALTTQN